MTSNDNFVTVEIFNERTNKTELQIVQLENKIDRHFDSLNQKIEMLNQKVDQNFAYINMRTDSIENFFFWGLAILAILATFAPSILNFFRGLQKPQITLEQIKEIVNETVNNTVEKAISKHIASMGK